MYSKSIESYSLGRNGQCIYGYEIKEKDLVWNKVLNSEKGCVGEFPKDEEGRNP